MFAKRKGGGDESNPSPTKKRRSDSTSSESHLGSDTAISDQLEVQKYLDGDRSKVPPKQPKNVDSQKPIQTVDQLIKAAKNNIPIPLRLKYTRYIHDPDVILRAARADPNEGRCLLVNDTFTDVEGAHALTFATPPDQIACLEAAWGYGPDQLRLDTRYNILFLRTSYHQLWDYDEWMLIPHPDIVNLLYDAYVTGANDKPHGKPIVELYKRKKFQYFMIPHPAGTIKRDTINRCTNPTKTSVEPDITFLRYPFHDLGLLHSHVHPHFVIVNAALKIERDEDAAFAKVARSILQKNLGMDMGDVFELFGCITRLHKTWLRDKEKYKNHATPCWELASADGFDGRSRAGKASVRSYHESCSSLPQKQPPQTVESSSSSRDLNTDSQSHLNDDDDESESEDERPRFYGLSEEDEVARRTRFGDWANTASADPASSKRFMEANARQLRNDEQLAAYEAEPTPSWLIGVDWSTWSPLKSHKDGNHPRPDTSRFSSTDWALNRSNKLLTRSSTRSSS